MGIAKTEKCQSMVKNTQVQKLDSWWRISDTAES